MGQFGAYLMIRGFGDRIYGSADKGLGIRAEGSLPVSKAFLLYMCWAPT